MLKKQIFLPSLLFLSLGTTPAFAVSYTYDPINRVVEADYPSSQTITFDYDDGGNLLNVQSLITAFATEGIVRDENGVPVGGATVTVAGQTTTTDPTGYFQLTGLSGGNYTLLAELAGVGIAEADLILNASSPAPGLTLVLQSELPNELPIADVGPNQSVRLSTSVTLDGSDSYDPDGDVPLSFLWQLVNAPAGSTANVLDAQQSLASMTLDLEGDYTLNLAVTDTRGGSSVPDELVISTVNATPIAEAGPDQAIASQNTVVSLDGSQSFDPDGDTLSYTWSLAAPSGSNASLSDATAINPSFTADVYGDYIASLTVSDPFAALSDPDSVLISFSNVPPVADAGPNQAVLVNDLIILDGSASLDANNEVLSYSWSLSSTPTGSSASLPNPTLVNPQFTADLAGIYTATLIVNDGLTDSSASNVTIVASNQDNTLTEQLETALDTLNGLDASSFKNANQKNWLGNKLMIVQVLIDQDDYQQALDKLQNDVLEKTDGCTDNGVVDNSDWIEDCVAQDALYQEISTLIALLEPSNTDLAQITSPEPNSTLDSDTVTFSWSNVSADQYWLEVGSTLGGGDYSGGDQGTNTSATVSGLPTDGSTVYVRLWTIRNGAWESADFQYATGSATGLAQVTIPTPNSTLSSDTVIFNWTNVGADQYWLEVGSTLGGGDYSGGDQGTNTSATVSGLPTDGSTVYVRLWTIRNGVWESADFQYSTGSATGLAQITTPAPNSTLSSDTVTFSWSDVGADQYWLEIGSTLGGSSYGGGDQGTNTSAIIPGLPTDGSTVYVRLWTIRNGVWESADFQYATGSATGLAQITTPAPNSTLSSDTVTFNWSNVGADQYWLEVGSTLGGGDYSGGDQGTNTSATISGLPTDGSTVYVRLWTIRNGAWESADFQYSTGSATGLAQITTPAPNSTLDSAAVTFNWSDVGADQYWLEVGASLGSSEYGGGDQGTSTSATITGLPTDGSTVYVRLWTIRNGVWESDDFQFTASTNGALYQNLLDTYQYVKALNLRCNSESDFKGGRQLAATRVQNGCSQWSIDQV